MGDAHLTEQEREEIANSSDFKEAADWLIAPGESLLLIGGQQMGIRRKQYVGPLTDQGMLPGPEGGRRNG